MHDADDMELLRQYYRQGSEAAFAALVQRHVNLVYSAAFRHVGIDAHAGEITQAVFIILARKAAGLRPGTLLESWLYETTRLTALSFLRGERRRQFREQEAYMRSTLNENSAPDAVWDQLAPLLDEAMARLGKKDREAVILRFFKEKSVCEVAAALRINEAAAQRRTLRALEKLRKYFSKRGVSSTTAILAGAISANSVQAAPVHLAKKIVATVSSMTGTLAISTFFGSVLGKVLVVCGSIAIVVVSAAIYFHTAGQSSNDQLPIISSQSVLVSNNQNGSISPQSSLNVSNTRPNLNDNAKLDEAIAHLRVVLHTRPITHEVYDSEKITNAIEEFGLYRRTAFNVLLDYASDSNTNADDSEAFVRAGSIFGMGYVGKFLPEASPVLWDMVSSAPIRERYYAFSALNRIGFDPTDLPALTGLLADEDSMQGIMTMLVPKAIANVLEKAPQSVAAYMPPLENLLNNGGSNVQFRAALALIKYQGTNNPNILPAIHALFLRPNDRNNQYYKDLAAQILGDVGPMAKPLVPDLLEFAKSASEVGVQEVAYDAVAKIEPDASTQNDDVAKALKEQEDDKMWQEKWKSGTYSLDDLRAALKDQYQGFTAANHLAEMGTNAIEAVPDMIRALWGKDEDTRNKILEDIYKVDPQAVVTKISIENINTGNLQDFLDKQPPTQQNKMVQQFIWTFLLSDWLLPDELADFTNKLAQQNQDAYKVFVKSQPREP